MAEEAARDAQDDELARDLARLLALAGTDEVPDDSENVDAFLPDPSSVASTPAAVLTVPRILIETPPGDLLVSPPMMSPPMTAPNPTKPTPGSVTGGVAPSTAATAVRPTPKKTKTPKTPEGRESPF